MPGAGALLSISEFSVEFGGGGSIRGSARIHRSLFIRVCRQRLRSQPYQQSISEHMPLRSHSSRRILREK